MKLEIRGDKEVIQKLDNLGRKAERTYIRSALRIGAKPMAVVAKEDAPVLTGTTQKLVKVRSGGTKKGAARMTVGCSAKDYTGDAWYASAVIYGHYVGNRKLGTSRTYVAPNNFLLRAFDSTKNECLDAIFDSLAEQIAEDVG